VSSGCVAIWFQMWTALHVQFIGSVETATRHDWGIGSLMSWRSVLTVGVPVSCKLVCFQGEGLFLFVLHWPPIRMGAVAEDGWTAF
jgi:hypothetical protein